MSLATGTHFRQRVRQRSTARALLSSTRHCHHTLGKQIFAGEKQLPLECDQTSVLLSARGRPRKAPCRYAVPLAEDAKDAEIKRLRQQLAAVSVHVRRRIGRKTSSAALAAAPPVAPMKSRRATSRQALNGIADASGLLGARDRDLPQEVHEHFQRLAEEGRFPISTLQARRRARLCTQYL